MEAVLNFLQAFVDALGVLYRIDRENFVRFFPDSGTYIYFTLRIVPLLVCIGVVLKPLVKYISVATIIDEATEKVKGLSKNLWSTPLPIATIVLTGAALRLWYAYTLPYIASEADAAARAESALNLFNKGYIHFSLGWPSAYSYLLNIARLFPGDFLFGARMVTVTLGIATIPVAYNVIKQVFNRNIALVSAALLAINPFHIKYSIVTMTEVPFVFFIFCSLWFLYKYIKTDKVFWLVLSSLVVNFNNLVRFEAWIIAALLPLFLLYHHKRLSTFFSYGLGNALTIIIYILISYFSSGMLIYGLTMSDLEVMYAYADRADAWQHIFVNMKAGGIYPAFIIPFMLLGFYMGIRKGIEVPWLLMSAFMMFFLSYKIVTLSSEPFWRYYAGSMFLALPYISLSLLYLAKRSLPFAIGAIIIISFSAQFNITAAHKYYATRQDLPKGMLQVAQWLKTNRANGEHIIYNSSGLQFPGFRLLSKIPSNEMYFPHYPGLKKFDFYEDYTPVVFLREMQKYDTKYVIVQNKSETDSFLRMPTVIDSMALKQIRLRVAYSNAHYRIYEVIHQAL